jgi:hypothetical protein
VEPVLLAAVIGGAVMMSMFAQAWMQTRERELQVRDRELRLREEELRRSFQLGG